MFLYTVTLVTFQMFVTVLTMNTFFTLVVMPCTMNYFNPLPFTKTAIVQNV